MFKKYKEVSKMMNDLNIDRKDKIKAFFLSLFLALIILIGPLILSINLLIFVDIVNLIIFMFGTIIFLLFFLTEYFYLSFLYKNIKGKYICYLLDLALPFVVAYATVIFLIIKGVI